MNRQIRRLLALSATVAATFVSCNRNEQPEPDETDPSAKVMAFGHSVRCVADTSDQ